MRIGLFVAYWPWFSPEEQIALARQADRAGLDSVWVAEAWGQDAVSVLGHLSAVTERVALGSGLMQIPGRTPAMTAMTAATLDVLSGGRFRLGLGRIGAAGVRGLARRAVLAPAGTHSRVRGDRRGPRSRARVRSSTTARSFGCR